MKYALIVLAGAGLWFAGCSEKSSEPPKAEASVSVDTGNAKDKVNNALDKAGDEMKKAGSEAKAKLQDAGDTLKEKAQEAKDKLNDTKKPSVDVDVKTK